ncbi:MAG: transglutaminase domain-containing protein, partial [Chloroflexota bacterium]
MRTRHAFHQGSVAVLAVATLLALAGLPVVAQETDTLPSLALPADAAIAADAQLTLDDEPGEPPGSFDLGAAEVDALRQADLLPAEDWEVEALAATLGDEPEAALAFVRERIAFDPYRGVLRGAEGTLAARSGNAFDRALLLAAIIEASGRETRFAFGKLDDDAIEDLLADAVEGAMRPIEDAHPSEVMTIDSAALVARARRDNALLRIALSDTFPQADAASERADQADAVRQHAWVQVDSGDGTWLDLDPSDPGGSIGGSLIEAETVATEMPGEVSQSVIVRVVAETLNEGILLEQVVLEEELPAEVAAGQELWLHFQPLLSGLSGSIVEAMGAAQWQPILIVDGEGRAGTEFALGASGDPNDFFGDFLGGGGPVLTALRLELESRVPGEEPLASQRVLFDRVLPADRENGVFVADLLAPLPADGTPPVALSTLHHVMVSNGGSSLRNHAVGRAFAANFIGNDLGDPELLAELPLHDLLLPLAVSDQTLTMASERLIVDGLSEDADVRAFVGRPRVFLSSFSPLPGVVDGTAIVTDLALDAISLVARPGTSGESVGRQRLWYGTLQSALETELALQRAQAVDPSGRIVASVSLDMSDQLMLLCLSSRSRGVLEEPEDPPRDMPFQAALD